MNKSTRKTLRNVRIPRLKSKKKSNKSSSKSLRHVRISRQKSIRKSIRKLIRSSNNNSPKRKSKYLQWFFIKWDT